MNIVILYSGGLDSLAMGTLARDYRLNVKVTKLFFNIGQPYLQRELAALPPDVIVKRLDWLDDNTKPVSKAESLSGDIYIPGRNAVFVTAAACQYLPDEIWLGTLAGEAHAGATDKNQEFLNRINSTLNYVLRPYRGVERPLNVRYPLLEMGFNKKDVVEYLLRCDVTPEQIVETSSCLKSEQTTDLPCGECVVCLRRWAIFYNLRTKRNLPTLFENYKVDPPQSKLNFAILNSVIDGILDYKPAYYDMFRTNEILPGLIDWIHDIYPKYENEWNPETLFRLIRAEGIFQ